MDLSALTALIPAEYLGYVTLAVTVASIFCALVPTPDPATTWGKVYALIEWVALLKGKAKDAPKSPAPTSRSDTSKVPGALLLAGVLGVSMLAQGCAYKQFSELSGPEQARVVADQLLDAYSDAYALYGQRGATMDQEQRNAIAKALNIAKPLVAGLASAACLWSAAAAGSDDAKYSAAWYASILPDAQAAMSQVAALITKIAGGK